MPVGGPNEGRSVLGRIRPAYPGRGSRALRRPPASAPIRLLADADEHPAGATRPLYSQKPRQLSRGAAGNGAPAQPSRQPARAGAPDAGLHLHLTADTCLVPLGALLPPLLLDALSRFLLRLALGSVCFVWHGSDLFTGCDIAHRAAGAGEPRTPFDRPLRAPAARTDQAGAYIAAA